MEAPIPGVSIGSMGGVVMSMVEVDVVVREMLGVRCCFCAKVRLQQ